MNNITPKTRRTAKGSFESWNGSNLYFVDLDTSEYLGIQGQPSVLNYDPTSRFTAVNSPPTE